MEVLDDQKASRVHSAFSNNTSFQGRNQGCPGGSRDPHGILRRDVDIHFGKGYRNVIDMGKLVNGSNMKCYEVDVGYLDHPVVKSKLDFGETGEYEKPRTDSNNAGGSGSANTGGTVAPEMHGCAEDDKVKFAMCTFEGRALTWWNGNVQTLGLANANQIPWSNVKAMMTTEYCPATEIQRMEQELWTLTLKGDDIEAYNNRFHELVLMCPELVSTEKEKD
ncbi:putative reverse transcriptase domain-containing protein [Tanacetum coccineum]